MKKALGLPCLECVGWLLGRPIKSTCLKAEGVVGAARTYKRVCPDFTA